MYRDLEFKRYKELIIKFNCELDKLKWSLLDNGKEYPDNTYLKDLSKIICGLMLLSNDIYKQQEVIRGLYGKK